MRRTKQNDLIYNIVNNSFNHPTAQQIYMECKNIIPNISLGTVYRNLNTLVESKKIQRIKTNNNIDRFDKIKDHSHFICVKCNKIVDIYESLFECSEYLDNNKILNCKITLEGVCQECLKEEERNYGIKRK